MAEKQLSKHRHSDTLSLYIATAWKLLNFSLVFSDKADYFPSHPNYRLGDGFFPHTRPCQFKVIFCASRLRDKHAKKN